MDSFDKGMTCFLCVLCMTVCICGITGAVYFRQTAIDAMEAGYDQRIVSGYNMPVWQKITTNNWEAAK